MVTHREEILVYLHRSDAVLLNGANAVKEGEITVN
jgi:hypothetical protein